MKTSYPKQLFFGILSTLYRSSTENCTKKTIIHTATKHGEGFKGNTKAIFEQLLKEDWANPIWLSRNETLIQRLKEQYGAQHAEVLHSWKGLRHWGKAHAILFTHGTDDYPFYKLPKNALKIQTYHGLPTKKGEYWPADEHHRLSWIEKKVLSYRFSKLTHFLSSSPFVTNIFSKRFGLAKEQFLETGYPSYDQLLQRNFNDNDSSEKAFEEGYTYVLYAPTFRIKSQTHWFPFEDIDFGALTNFLEKKQIVLLLKPHPNDKPPDLPYQQHPNLRILGNGEFDDTIAILPHIHAVLTDYSSVYLEALLVDLPTFFIPYDKAEYERGFPFNYNESITGPQLTSQNQLIKELGRLQASKEEFALKRQEIKSMFFSAQTAHSTLAVVEWLKHATKTQGASFKSQ